MKLTSILAVIGLSFLSVFPAAAFECEPAVVDETGNLSRSVDAEIDRMRSLGIEPRVRVIKTHSPYANLDVYEDKFVATCLVLQDGRGVKRGNLITLIVEMEHRQIGLYYGANYHGALDATWVGIKDQIIIPRLRNGRFHEAVSEGLKRVTDTIHVYENPPVMVDSNDRPAERPIDNTNTELRQTSGGIFNVIIGLGAVVLLVIGGWFISLRRRRNEMIDRNYGIMDESLAKCRDLIFSDADPMKSIDGLEKATVVAFKEVGDQSSPEDVRPLAERYAELRQTLEEVMAEWMKLEGVRSKTRRSDTDAVSMLHQGYDALLPKLGEAFAQQESFHREVKGILGLIQDAPGEIAKVKEDLRFADQEIGKVQAAEYHFDEAMSLYQRADSARKAAEWSLSERRFVQMRQQIEEAVSLARQSAESAKRLPQERERLLASVKLLEDSAREVNLLRGQALEAFDRMEKKFAKSSWSSIARNGSEADRHIADAKQVIEVLPELLSMKFQKWDEAEKARSFAERALQESRSLLEAVLHQERSINSSKEKTAEELEAARADIDKARDFLAKYGSPTKQDLVVALDKAKALVAEAEAESRKRRPDFLLVIKRALEANAAADKVFAKANSQKEEKERKIRLSNTAVSEAEDAVASARNYLMIHMGDLGHRGYSLMDAERELSAARSINNVDEKIRRATRSQSLAEDVLSRATSEVMAAENERRRLREEEDRQRRRRQEADDRAQRRRSETSSYTSSPSSSSSSSGSDWGGGGSSSFGSFGSGGGGSSSW